jgi:hypothetical protein
MPLGESNTMNAIEVAQNNFKSPRGTFVTSDGVQLSYIRQGSGRPIVLVHGWVQVRRGIQTSDRATQRAI